MTFLYPAFGWAFLNLGVILLLYLLRRRYQDRSVPSTFLWQRTARDLSASRPFQKLRRNLLLPLHLLMAAVLALILMRPVLPGGMAGEAVMIFDLSASMGAEENGVSRLEAAVDRAEGILDGMGRQDALTILAVDGETHQLLSRSADREAARRVLRSLRPANVSGDLSAAVSMAQAMGREMPGLRILVFSDAYVAENGDIAVYNAEKGLENRAVQSFTVENGRGYARVVNYGGACEVTLACYAGDTLCDARTLQLPEGESAGVSFVLPECAYARVEIQEKDAIAADNSLYFVPKTQRHYTVALSEVDNVFLERAVALWENVTLVRTAGAEKAAAQADLYIDGGGASCLLFSRDATGAEIAFGEALTPEGALTFAGGQESLTAGLTLREIAVRAYRPLTGGRAILTLDGHPVLAATDRAVALGFDLSDTNLPMKYDFPILIQNILRYLLPDTAADVGDGNCGESILIPLTGDEEAAFVLLPDGQQIAPPDPLGWNAQNPLTQTGQTGLYTLVTRRDGQETQRSFALRMPLSESDVRFPAPSSQGAEGRAALAGGRDLTGLLLLLFLGLLLVEWGVSRRAL